MCLSRITKTKKHEFGYKLFKRENNHFVTNIFISGPYNLGETYDAEVENYPNPIPTEEAAGGGSYTAGYHYYLRLKDAKGQCNIHDVVIRIKVKNIFATGTQYGYECGVSQIMKLDRVMLDGKKRAERKRRAEYKKFLEICSKKVQSKMLQYAKDCDLKNSHQTPDGMKNILDFLTKDYDEYEEFISFIDILPRNSRTFILFTKLHIWGLHKHNQYKKFFKRLVKRQSEIHSIVKYYRFAPYAENIDKIVLKQR